MTQDAFIMRSRLEPFNELEQHWMDVLRNQIVEVIQHNIPFTRIVFISLYGSQNYHLAGSFSDIDSECFIFPSIHDFCFLDKPTSFKLHTEHGDIYVKDIRLMFDELRKSSPNILELLASNYMWINKDYQYYFLPILKNVDNFAQLSTYKLLKGLEGLFKRYSNPLDLSSKYLVNAMRIQQMISRIIAGEDFSSTLIPYNATELFNIKYCELEDNANLMLEHIALVTYDILNEYFNSHEFVFQSNTKAMIDEYQQDLMLKYIHSI